MTDILEKEITTETDRRTKEGGGDKDRRRFDTYPRQRVDNDRHRQMREGRGGGKKTRTEQGRTHIREIEKIPTYTDRREKEGGRRQGQKKSNT